jgi:hypothetical protein
MPRRENVRSWALQNKVTLTSFYKRKQPPLWAIENFLAQAMVEFKQRREAQQEPNFEGEYLEGLAVYGRNVRATCHLVHAPDIAGNYLPADDWVKVVVSAHTAATTVGDIIDQIDAYRTKASGWLKEVITALDERGDLDAFEVVLDHINSSDFHGL